MKDARNEIKDLRSLLSTKTDSGVVRSFVKVYLIIIIHPQICFQNIERSTVSSGKIKTEHPTKNDLNFAIMTSDKESSNSFQITVKYEHWKATLWVEPDYTVYTLKVIIRVKQY